MDTPAITASFSEDIPTNNGSVHPKPIVSRETRELVELVFYAVLTTLVCLVGIPTNILNCLVFWRQGLKDRMNLCLFALSAVDFCYLLCAFFMFSLGTFLVLYNKMLGDKYQTNAIADLFGVAGALRSMSRFIGVVIAVERCVCVVFPLAAATIMRTSAMAVTIVVALVVFQGLFVLVPLGFKAELVSIAGEQYWMFIRSPFGLEYRALVDTMAYTVLGFVVPVSTLFIVIAATVITVIKLRAAITWRKRTSSASGDSASQQEALTVMLVTVSAIHVVTMAPSVALELGLWFTADYFAHEEYWELLKTVDAVANVFPPINSSVNFFVYYARSSRFRVVLNQLVGKLETPPSTSAIPKITSIEKDNVM